MEVIDAFRQLDFDMPSQMIQGFLIIVTHRGIVTRELAERLGQDPSSATRLAQALGKWQRFGQPGHDLIEVVENPKNRREKQAYLTAKGEKFLHTLRSIVR